MRKLVILLALAASPCGFAQAQGGRSQASPDTAPNFLYRSVQGAGGAGVAVSIADKESLVPVVGAPYSAAITNETVQTLADGNRIVLNTTGEVARDSQGRTRQQMELPAIGNLAAANPPQIVIIRDPVAQVSYTLNLTEKTAQQMPNLPVPSPGTPGAGRAAGGQNATFVLSGNGAVGDVPIGPVMTTDGPIPPPLPPPPSQGMVFIQRGVAGDETGQTATEDLGSRTMQGVTVNGTRSTLTIPAGQIGNEQPVKVVTEVWTSPDVKAIVYSKRSDPRMGEQTFQLTNISRN
jgi:hypothetical protein